MIGIDGLQRLVALVAKIKAVQLSPEPSCISQSPPPSICQSVETLWSNLPKANQKRLVSVLSQMLESQMAIQTQEEEEDEPQR
ncbi:hypothetical protein Lepto7375DRAFT_2651 [Leptolyngbya sp. PCC 7375]|nr:hypothetical protein Lepto7375DRAFT_0645 [Leptolyngbya sp. PCC 7375]EKU99402.1 hypothetical protein Lepto7375DRAFT_1439 [Leptolyngbya sp. PCC 7375]EKV00531.1 hypothetical protein Lepto7375DRAFT_2651 [Leptolyngbya sp. PCC 7375]